MAEQPDYANGHAGPLPLKVPLWAGRYIGIKFKDDGHGFDGSNCFGLVYLVLKHQCGIEINPQSDVSAADVERASIRAQVVASCAPWMPVVGEPRLYDVALIAGKPLHTGIVVGEEALLHIWRAPEAMAMHLRNPHLRSRLIGFYRHSALA